MSRGISKIKSTFFEGTADVSVAHFICNFKGYANSMTLSIMSGSVIRSGVPESLVGKKASHDRRDLVFCDVM